MKISRMIAGPALALALLFTLSSPLAKHAMAADDAVPAIGTVASNT